MNRNLPLAALFSLVVLAACGGSGKAQAIAGQGDASSASPPATTPATTLPNTPPAETSAGSQVRALEASGALPSLDRSDAIAGPDANGNGVRDDIEQWIDNRQDLTPAQKRAALQMAAVMQRLLLVDLKDDAALQASAEASADAVSCLHDNFTEFDKASKLGRQIEAFTANTEPRARRYLAYNARRGGTTTRMLNTNTCL